MTDHLFRTTPGDTSASSHGTPSPFGFDPKLEAMFSHAPAAVAVYRGPTHVVAFMNPSCRRLFGGCVEYGRPLIECAPELAGSVILKVLEQAYALGEPVSGKELLLQVDRRGDGTLEDGFFNFTVQPMRDEHGRVEGVVAFAVEVTDEVLARRKSEQLAAALEAERFMVDQVIHQMPHAVFIAEAPSGRLVRGNPQASEQLRKPFVSSPSFEDYQIDYTGFHADGRPYEAHEWPLARAIQHGHVVESEPVEMVRGDGTRAVIEYSAAPLRDPQGRIVAGVVVGVDATARTRMLQAEQRRAVQLKGLAEASVAISSAGTLTQVLEEITERARALVGAHQSVISMTIDGNLAQAINAVSLSDKYAEFRSYSEKPDGSGIYALVCRISKPFRMTQAELEAHPAFKRFGAHAATHPPMRGWLAVPLTRRDGQNIGLIQLSDKYEGEFTEDDEAILVQLAQFASVAIENAHLRDASLAAEQRFRSLIETTAAVVWTAGPDGVSAEDSPSWRAFTGQSLDMWLGTGWLEVVHPDDYAQAASAWKRAIETRTRYEVEYRLRRHDGTWADTIARAVPILEPDGAVREWVGCNIDISDIRRAEEALRAQHRLTRTITDNAALGLLMMDAHQRCTFMNPAAEKITGFSFAELQAIDKPMHDVIHHERPDGSSYPREECPINRALPTRSQQQGEDVFVHKSGAMYPVAFTASPILAGDTPLGTVIEVRDITAQKRAEEERERLIRALERSNAELDQFAYVTSHDLKSPLRGIANLSQWIEDDLGDKLEGETRSHMNLLRGRVKRMEALIDGVLNYSRAGRSRHKAEPVDVARLLSDVVELLAPPEGARIEIAADMPTLTTERVPLQQVFMNLVGNALKYACRDDARISIGWRDGGSRYAFSVADNGPGIAPEFQGRIWGLFQRLEARDKVEGAGIGLSVVKKIVESRGGLAWVESAAGEGATFHFTWPKRTPAET